MLSSGNSIVAAIVFTTMVALFSTSCSKPSNHEAEFFVFGTLVEVSLSGASDDQAQKAFTLLQQRFQEMHRNWHAWEPGQLTRINQAFSQGNRITASPDLHALVQHSQEVELKTAGRFNPAIGQLIERWGFHTSDFPVSGPPPNSGELAALLANKPSSLDIAFHQDELFSRNSAVQLDFGGIAKGFAVDIACAELKSLGIQNAIVNAGGDLRAFGSVGQRPWRVAIRNPLGGMVGGLEIQQDESVFTSGNYERYLETETHERFPHIIDPRSGLPARQLMSATVVTHDGWFADAAATAFVVGGLSEWAEIANALGIEMVLLTDEQGRLFATKPLLDRLILAPGQELSLLTQEGQ